MHVSDETIDSADATRRYSGRSRSQAGMKMAKQTKTSTAKPAAKAGKPAVAAKPVAAPVVESNPQNARGYVQHAVDTVITRLIAAKHTINVAAIAKAAGERSVSPDAQRIADELSKLASVAGKPALAISAKRVQADIAYQASVGKFGADGRTYAPRGTRAPGRVIAEQHLALAMNGKPARKAKR